MASSMSAGRLVARKMSPSKRSISVNSSVISEEPPAPRCAKSDSHSSKKTTAFASSASRRIDWGETPPLFSARSSGKLTSSTLRPRRRATALAVMVLPLPEGPHSMSTMPSGCGIALASPTLRE